MKLFLWCTLFTICTVHFTQAGIYRRYVRNRPRPPMVPTLPHNHHRIGRRDFQAQGPVRPWISSFFPRRPRSPWMFQLPRMARRYKFQEERIDRVPHFHHQPQARHYTPNSRTTRIPMTWRPMEYGNPIDRDPTYDYAPPSVERVRFGSETSARNRQPTVRSLNVPPFGRPTHPPPSFYPSFNKRPSSLWKMLAHKQRPKRPYGGPRQPVRYLGQSPNQPLYHHQAYQAGDEAEIFPNIQNMVYFHPTDVVPSSRRPIIPSPFRPGRPSKVVEPAGKLKPGVVADASLYSGEMTSTSELKPVSVVKPVVKPKPTSGGNKEYIFTVVGFKGPISTSTRAPIPVVPSGTNWNAPQSRPVTTTTRKPTVLHAVKTTPITISTTHNSLIKPFQPTESLSHRDEIEVGETGQESSIVEKVVNRPGKESSGDTDIDNLDMVPPAPIFPVVNSFNILDSHKVDDDDEDLATDSHIPTGNVNEINGNEVKPRPVFNNGNNGAVNFKTSTSISVSVSKTEDEFTTKAPAKPKVTPKSTTTSKPTTSSTTTTARTTTESSTTPTTSTSLPTTVATSPKSTKFPRLPTMPTYKKKPTPVYARKNKNSGNGLGGVSKYSSSSSSADLTKEINGSGEIVVITAGRSKVKEYKPQFIADNTQLLSFDKVSENSTPISLDSSSPSPSTSTIKSPLQEFDPMQLLHSWFTKSSD